ncbi:gamma-glutamyltransferase [Sphingobium boeckii]|uniref:Glutathione hydrolase proenzyme n=1 Tax=Sphingobium boeckii TaxID=1082345 RepID=A0A7W9AF97_9SPHN|nr:gamma-glutamyltransferase [Sphingobium boeckii]MBB5684361.1 gamma-glutamyltranspeptidase/glutathione hydrolase [Sphingobium boeckii]
MKKILVALLAFLLIPNPVSAKGGVASAADPRAAEAGRTILREGGSAADAQMAMMLALTVVEPQSSGIGGGGFFVYHDAKAGKTFTVDGREKAPMSASPRLFLGADGRPLNFLQAFPGGKSVGVPGNIRLMEVVHRKWGTLPWAALFAPAIKLADEGFAVTPVLESRIAGMGKLWDDFPAIKALYWQDGRPKRVGDTVRNPALATLLRTVAAEGPDSFYSGDIAASIVNAVAQTERNPTMLTRADLASYRAAERAPVCFKYRVYKLCGMGPPSSGATTVFQILGMLERFDMKKMGKDSPAAWHLIAEAMQLAYADREKYLGDPDFVSVPVKGLLDKTYIKSRSRLISEAKALGSYNAGTPPGAEKRTAAISSEVAGTTNFAAADGSGNLATMTSTVEGPFGSQLIASGMVLNNELTDFTFAPEKDGAPVANAVAAGKRPLSSMSPTMVYDAKGRPILALGSAGGKRIIMHVTKTLIGVLDFGLPAQDAIALPNIYFGGNAVLVEQGTPLAALQADLAALGQKVVSADLGSKVNAVERTPSGWRGAFDPRSEGAALAE